MNIGQIWGGGTGGAADSLAPGAVGQVYTTNAAGEAVWADPEATDSANLATVISAATTLDASAGLRYLVDTTAADVSVTLALADKQAVNLRNVGPNKVQIVLSNGTHFDPSGSTGPSSSFLNAQADQLTLVNHAGVYYPE